MLPKRFHRLRHYGFLSNGNTGLQTALELLILEEEVSNKKNEELAEKYYLDTDTIRNCPLCHCSRMTTVFAMDKNGRIVKGEDLIQNNSRFTQFFHLEIIFFDVGFDFFLLV